MPKRKNTFKEYSRARKYAILSSLHTHITETDEASSTSTDTEDFTSGDASDTLSDVSNDEKSNRYKIKLHELSEKKNNAVFLQKNTDNIISGEASESISHFSSGDSYVQSESDFYSSDSENFSEDDSDSDTIVESNDENEPLYPGAPLTVAESNLAIFTAAKRCNFSGVQLNIVLSLIQLHCIQPNNCIKTLYKFKKFFSKFDDSQIKHFYCKLCLFKIDKDYCENCNKSEINYFIEISILKQLSSMFKRDEFRLNLNYRFTRIKQTNNNYEDIFDGSIYKSLPENFTSNSNNITFTWNSDGVPLFKSSKISIWPLYLMVNELPYALRIKKENIIVAGLWFGTMKPSVNMFLSAFEKQLQELYNGVDIEIPNDINFLRIRGMIVMGTCDLPAKALYQNMQQYNGRYGCPNCEIKTKRVENVQIYPFTQDLILRTTESTRLYAQQALESSAPVIGIKGPTILRLIVYNHVESTAIDEMHCVYQGTMKKLMSFWFDPDHRSHSSSLYQYVNIIDERIKILKPPAFVNRFPRKVSEYSYWKASELRLFLLVYSLPLLHIFMRKRFFEHHILLVFAISLLNFTSVSNEMIKISKQLLIEYVLRFEDLYEEKCMTCNVHLLLHLSDDVKKFGPLYVMSCFPFENLNGILKSYVHGSKHPELQISSAINSFMSLNELKHKFIRINSSTDNFCKEIERSGTHRRKLKKNGNDSFIVGSCKKMQQIPNYISEIFKLHDLSIEIGKCHIFSCVLKNGIYYETDDYTKKKKSNSSCIEFQDNNRVIIGIIKNFFKICKCACMFSCYDCNVNCKTYAIIAKCTTERVFKCEIVNKFMPTMYSYKETDKLSLIDVNSFINVCFNIRTDEKSFAVRSLINLN